MLRSVSLADSIGAVEPTFQAQNAWSGYWTLGGRPAYVRSDGEWLETWTPLCGEARRLLGAQGSLAGLAKVAPGDFLRAEMPADPKDCGSAFRILCGELERGLDHFEGVEPWPAAPAGGEWIERVLGDNWSRKGARFLIPLEDDPSPALYAAAEAMEDSVAIRAVLVRLRDAGPTAMAALTHFALALNEWIRMARVSLELRQAVLEVVLPRRCASPWLARQALGALRAGAAAARRECAALLDPAIANAYLQFHSKGART